MMIPHVRPIVLWRESSTYCECAWLLSRWTLRLRVGRLTAVERVFDGVGPMLRIAHLWREALLKEVPDTTANPTSITCDRRQTPPERRAVARGGRRGTEPQRSQLDPGTLLSEVASLWEENAMLRDSALSFGALAERLSQKLKLRGDSSS